MRLPDKLYADHNGFRGFSHYFLPLFFARFPAPAKLTAMPVSGTRKKRIPPFHISRKGAKARRRGEKRGNPRLCGISG
ncbi:MAG: hypothetical protein B6245_10435 [Desulfobacteraceae bacterium 4572_88]|nr:MAG: hypothetical protein B6245_10435 [Desulfobacteraceae bacterium 4572_88]